MSLFRIFNQHLSVTIDSYGAQLMSIQDTSKTEYLWQGSNQYWKDRALTLFPYVARLTNSLYSYEGKTYALPIHGFAPYCDFSVHFVRENSISLVLKDSKNTFSCYPFHFSFFVTFMVHDVTLSVNYHVLNEDEKDLFFGIGGHPGFNLPFGRGRFEDYLLRFSHPSSPNQVEFSDDCLLTGVKKPFALENQTVIHLSHSMFDHDAIVLSDVCHEVSLETEKDRRKIVLSFPDMPYLGIWHTPKTAAPFICLEPWGALPSREGIIEDLKTQPSLIHLGPRDIYKAEWSVKFLNE